jgi:hypothetical protein
MSHETVTATLVWEAAVDYSSELVAVPARKLRLWVRDKSLKHQNARFVAPGPRSREECTQLHMALPPQLAVGDGEPFSSASVPSGDLLDAT